MKLQKNKNNISKNIFKRATYFQELYGVCNCKVASNHFIPFYCFLVSILCCEGTTLDIFKKKNTFPPKFVHKLEKKHVFFSKA